LAEGALESRYGDGVDLAVAFLDRTQVGLDYLPVATSCAARRMSSAVALRFARFMRACIERFVRVLLGGNAGYGGRGLLLEALVLGLGLPAFLANAPAGEDQVD